jgi:hypothetical protein
MTNQINPHDANQPPRGECDACGSARCRALVRANKSPKDWKDVVDRMFLLISSGHWSWPKTNQVLTTVFIPVATAVLSAPRLTLIHIATDSPWGWGAASSIVAALVSGSVLYRRRRTGV